LNKYLPYFFSLLIGGALIILFVTGNNKKDRRLDQRITLRKKDKIPYGAAVAYSNLQFIFPQAAVYASRQEPGYWDSLSNYESKQVFISISGRLNADESELKRLISFAENGNDVFISTRYLSAAADRVLKCNSSSFSLSLFADEDMDDSLHISLTDPPFGKDIQYSYPGKKFDSYFNEIDSTTTDILGYNENGHPNFIHLRAGKGNFYVQLEPLAFSNYFLLHKNNIHYYENALSVIPADVKKIVWDEYYLNKRSYGDKNQQKSWLSVLFRFPALKAALLTAIFALLLYVLLEMRRRQRYIPLIAKPRNDSLDFVKTIGRLYYDKGDHKNICSKMSAYFLEHVRNRYKLATSNLNDEFIKSLQHKTGCEEGEIRGIVSYITSLDEAETISQNQLMDFHKRLELFYKKT
jgi:hypothetical protein